MSIFISIASYRDPRLWATVADAVAQASAPQHLHVCIVDQSDAPSDPPANCVPRLGSLRYTHVHHRFSRGACWARSIAMSCCQSEDYFLQIDAHMAFDAGWDERLVTQLEALSADNPRAILSTYPAPFELVDGAVQRRPFPGQALVLAPKPEARLAEDMPVLAFHAVPHAAAAPLPGCHVGAGCLFTRTAFIAEVPYDPWLYFHGEEQNLAVRAWTRGWDIWHMPDMPIYHLYHGGHDRPVHWSPDADAHRDTQWWSLETQSRARMRALLYERRDLGAYGLGKARSLDDFAAFSGIDYTRRTLRPTAAPR
ncbi:GlcNAc-transferase family protein [uncultured Pseudacidovorax sp.]|uniref:GlcNAc-transferase family protein n=1 Tax=uncultured Pseudacidovorax sp. TaxID=679313 RepID=UPI0025F9A662|nr:GlcNAc-transferase family protein [uncultured Pseudacidovorax sp.]